MFWSDLSTIRKGFLANLRNFTRLAADAPDIIYASLGPDVSHGTLKDYLVLRVLRCLVCLAFWTIYFPIVAYNIAYGVLFLWLFVFRTLNSVIDDSRIELTSPADLTFAASSLLSLGVIIVLMRRNSPAEVQGPVDLDWRGDGGSGRVGVEQYRHSAPRGPDGSLLADVVHNDGLPGGDDLSELFRHDPTLGALWFIPIGIGAVYLLMLPLLIVFFRDRWRGLLLGYATMFLTVRLWLIVITTSWLLILSATLDSERMAKLVNEILRSGKYVSLIWLDVIVMALVFAVSYARP